MKKPEEIESSAKLIEHQAAGWVLRESRGLTPAEQDEFLQWLAADKRHGLALSRHRQTWSRLDLLGQWLPEHATHPNRDLLAPPAKLRLRTGRLAHLWWLVSVPLAAAIVIGLFLARPNAPMQKSQVQDRVPVSIAAVERRVLEDGSIIELNRGAEVEVTYTESERRVQLKFGEAIFNVAKNPDRPFIVKARGIEVHAVGTAFDVRLGSGAVEVLVTEGKVRIEQADPNGVRRETTVIVPVLGRGGYTVVSTARLSVDPQVYTVAEAQLKQILAWEPRMLDFNRASLREIVAEFNRCNEPFHLIIGDPNLAEMEMSATLRSDNIDGLIRLLEAGFGAHAERVGNKIILRRR